MKSSLREKDQCTAMDLMLAGGLEPVIFKEKQRWVCSALREGEGRGALTVAGRSCRARLLLEVHNYPERCMQPNLQNSEYLLKAHGYCLH